jgi:hypothetical protein
MILLPHVREIKVTDLIILIKADKKFPVPDGDISGHGSVTPFV